MLSRNVHIERKYTKKWKEHQQSQSKINVFFKHQHWVEWARGAREGCKFKCRLSPSVYINTAQNQIACRGCWADYVWEEFDGQNLMGGNIAPSGRQNSMAKYGTSWWVEFAHPFSVVSRIWVMCSLCIQPLPMKHLIQQTIPDIVLEIRFWLFNQVLLLQDRYLLQWRWNTRLIINYVIAACQYWWESI